MIKKLLGISPKPDSESSFSPSPLALKLATAAKTDYDHSTFQNACQGKAHKVLMICTEERYMTMQNGKRFSTGNHPVEMMVPMLHLQQAGFEIDIATPTGKPVKIEMWAMPEKDAAVQKIYRDFEPKLESPMSLPDCVQNLMQNGLPYMAVFIPGGHGAMLGLPDNRDLKKVIHWVVEKDKYMFCICHGPAALLAAGIEEDENTFVYKGYKMAVFPDALDKKTPLIGYMPGHMPWYFGERLKKGGVEIVNKSANGTCIQDRKLITGDGPKAANQFGKLIAEALLNEVNA